MLVIKTHLTHLSRRGWFGSGLTLKALGACHAKLCQSAGVEEDDIRGWVCKRKSRYVGGLFYYPGVARGVRGVITMRDLICFWETME